MKRTGIETARENGKATEKSTNRAAAVVRSEVSTKAKLAQDLGQTSCEPKRLAHPRIVRPAHKPAENRTVMRRCNEDKQSGSKMNKWRCNAAKRLECASCNNYDNYEREIAKSSLAAAQVAHLRRRARLRKKLLCYVRHLFRFCLNVEYFFTDKHFFLQRGRDNLGRAN